jgi:hypothetical protein
MRDEDDCGAVGGIKAHRRIISFLGPVNNSDSIE